MHLSVQPRDQKTGFYPSTTWILLLEAGEVLSHSASLFQVPSPPLTPAKLVISIHKTQGGKTGVNASARWTVFFHSSRQHCCCCCQVASVVSDSGRPHRWQPTRLPRLWDSPGKNTGVGCHCLL